MKIVQFYWVSCSVTLVCAICRHIVSRSIALGIHQLRDRVILGCSRCKTHICLVTFATSTQPTIRMLGTHPTIFTIGNFSVTQKTMTF